METALDMYAKAVRGQLENLANENDAYSTINNVIEKLNSLGYVRMDPLNMDKTFTVRGTVSFEFEVNLEFTDVDPSWVPEGSDPDLRDRIDDEINKMFQGYETYISLSSHEIDVDYVN
jgi:hypothetical protein